MARLSWRIEKAVSVTGPNVCRLWRGATLLAIVQQERASGLWFSYGMGDYDWNTYPKLVDLDEAKRDAVRRIKEAEKNGQS